MTITFLITSYLILSGCSQAQQSNDTGKQNQVSEQADAGVHNIISAAEFKKHLDAGEDIILVDVRTPGEYEQGHIPGSKLLDFSGNDFKKDALKLDKSVPLFVYCHSGSRSGRASEFLAANGYTVFDLQGGIMAWKNAGYNTEK